MNIQKHLKLVAFNLIMFFAIMLNFIILLPCLVLPSNRIQGCFRPIIKLTFFLLKVFYGVKIRLVGYEHVDNLIKAKQNFIIAPKHQSSLDIYFILLLFDAPVFILKKELLMMPFLGLYILFSKMITIDRKRGIASLKKILKNGKKAFSQNRPLIIFPEGTRVKVNESVNYKSGIVAVYNHLQVPVIPVASNSAEVWSEGYFFNGAKSKFLKISILPPIQPGLNGNEFVALLKSSIEDEMDRIHSSDS